MSQHSLMYNGLRLANHTLNNSLLRWLDVLARIHQPNISTPPLFILGVPRSGTTLAYQLITYKFQVGYVVNAHNLFFGCPKLTSLLLHPFLKRPRPVFESSYGRPKYQLSPAETGAFWRNWFLPDDVLGHYIPPTNISSKAKIELPKTLASLQHIHQRPMVFKSVYLSLAAGTLAQIFPNARFIMVTRDILCNCQSLLFARKKHGQGWWSVRPPGYKAWLKEPLWKQVAYQVCSTQMILQQELEKYATGRYFHLPYELLCAKPRERLADLGRWLAQVGYMKYDSELIPASFNASTQRKVDAKLWQKWNSLTTLWQNEGVQRWI